MSYIAPDSELQFFQNLNIDVDYENTIYFPTTTAKDTYFDNIPSIKCPSCTYQRERRGFCRVEVPTSQMYGRSYMRFKNRQFENKWFYAFILSVVYINNITTEVEYKIDEMMTWMGSYTIDQCFVERNHTETDDIGDNIVPENLPVDLLVNESIVRSGLFDDWAYLAVFTPDSTNLPSSLNSYGFPTSYHYSFMRNLSDINSLPTGLLARLSGLYYVPMAFIPELTDTQNLQPDIEDNGSAPVTHTNRVYGPTAGSPIDGYTDVRNNKLYTYPYYRLTVENSEGEKCDYLFELTRTNYIDFEFRGIVGELTQIALIPKGYDTPEWDTQNNYPNYSKMMEMVNFPMIGWAVDTYKMFLAQQLVTLPSTVVGVGAAILSENPIGAATTAVQPIVKVVEGAIKHQIKPTEVRGQNTPQLGLAVGNEYKDFFFYKRTVKGYQAKIIDNYFSMYGYAINEVTQPKINVRPYYTYVKTIGCHINGSFPEDSKRVIEQCFNQGIRFWKEDHTHIGDYTVNNAPTP